MGPLDLKPWEFGRLQPHEFDALLEGYRWRKESNEDMMAYFTSWLMNIHLKEPIGPAELLKPLREQHEEKKQADEEYLLEAFKGVLG